MTAYYNEFNTEAAAWLRELIKEKLIADGDVDERSIIEVEAKELEGYSQHHFFAGIGGWSYALRLAGWPDDRPVWTASLPCQPFSVAGKQQGKNDERHLLPHFLELVKQCRPDVIFGEQVERAIAHGWLDDLQTTMEAEDYAVGHCVLGAHSIGAAHIRQRLYWVGLSNGAGSQQRIEAAESARHRDSVESAGANDCWLGNAESIYQLRDREPEARDGQQKQVRGSSLSWIECRDGKLRPIEPGILPLAHGLHKGMVYSSDSCVPFDENSTQEARKMRLHGYGNAIVPQLAAEFIGAFMDISK